VCPENRGHLHCQLGFRLAADVCPGGRTTIHQFRFSCSNNFDLFASNLAARAALAFKPPKKSPQELVLAPREICA
jgi:hypothetical protein